MVREQTGNKDHQPHIQTFTQTAGSDTMRRKIQLLVQETSESSPFLPLTHLSHTSLTPLTLLSHTSHLSHTPPSCPHTSHSPHLKICSSVLSCAWSSFFIYCSSSTTTTTRVWTCQRPFGPTSKDLLILIEPSHFCWLN